MEQSILKSIKKVCNVDPSLTVFDTDFLMHINGVFARLHQLGVGPANGFMIEDDSATWGDFLGENPLVFNQVKTYIYLSVRIVFDPPQTGYLIEAMNDQIEKMEWTLNVVREGMSWTDPSLPA